MAKKVQNPITVGFVSLGCPKNTVDSERMLAEIAQAGFLITAEPDNADVVVVNTCAFIAPAIAESIEVISSAVARKRRGTVKKVIVAGCLSQRLREELFSQVHGIDAVIGLDARDSIARVIEQSLVRTEPLAWIDRAPTPHGDTVPDDRTRLLITPAHRAYLRISEGCNHRCSFCTIPRIRGRFRSKPPELVIAEARQLVAHGVVELSLIGQDTASYGSDLGIKNGLARILGELEKIDKLAWIRLMYLYPTGITARLLETIAASDKVLHYLDIPIQHISRRLLKQMRRGHTAGRIPALIERLRAAMPDVALRTTLIAGFPGETHEEFTELLDFVRWAKFDALGCFPYYREPGTPAAEMPAQVPDDLKQHRLQELMLAQQQIAFAKNAQRIGSELECLVDRANTSTATGRFYGQAPEIDGLCMIENCSAEAGEFIKTTVVANNGYDLVVRQL